MCVLEGTVGGGEIGGGGLGTSEYHVYMAVACSSIHDPQASARKAIARLGACSMHDGRIYIYICMHECMHGHACLENVRE